MQLALELEVVEESLAGFEIDNARLQDLTSHVLRAEGACGNWSIAVALVSDERLQELHGQFMQDESPTDIMTFPHAGEGEPPIGGDLIISVAHLHGRAHEWGLTPSEELEFLLAHGVLHLLGYRDASPGARKAMLQRQRDHITAWQAASAP